MAASSLTLVVSLSIALFAIVAWPPDKGPASPVVQGTVELSASPVSFPYAVARVRDAEPSPTPTASPVLAQVVNGPQPLQATEAPAPAPAPALVPEPAALDVPPPPPPAPPPPAPTPAPTPVPIPGGYRNDVADALYGLFNSVRAQNGLGAVSANGSLVAAAQGYSQYHFVYHDPYALSHNLNGSPGDRAWGNGFCCGVGEILATAEGSAQTFLDLWLNSPPHRDIILDPAYVSVGISCYSGPYTGSNGSQSNPILCVADWGTG